MRNNMVAHMTRKRIPRTATDHVDEPNHVIFSPHKDRETLGYKFSQVMRSDVNNVFSPFLNDVPPTPNTTNTLNKKIRVPFFHGQKWSNETKKYR